LHIRVKPLNPGQEIFETAKGEQCDEKSQFRWQERLG